jgi:type 1 glutamine amidotransferase
LSALLAVLLALATCPSQDAVGGKPYVKLATREATREAMLERLSPTSARFGEWHLSTPFPYAGHGKGDLATPHAPEEELSKMRAGGPGPDFAATYTGKQGVRASWRALGRIENRRVDLRVNDRDELNENAACYLHGTITCEADCLLPLTLGSDDGLRLWVNGALLVDRDVPRSLDPDAEKLRLELSAGVNHVFAKVAQGGGDWEFQINSRKPLGGVEDTELAYFLDRDFPPSPEREHYRVFTYPVPEELVLEVGGLAFLGDGRPLVCTRRGDVFAVDDAYAEPPRAARFRLFASGLHEPLGLAVRRDADGEAVYTVQRAELTRLVDDDRDGRADRYETFCDGWGVSGNYHEFAFGPKFDREGNAWVTLNLGFCGGLGKAIVPWRGWALKITPKGELVPVCDGLRSPNGIGMAADGAMFYVDNQGDYVCTNRLSQLEPGSWHGHPASLRWRTDLAGPSDRPPRADPVVWFPYRKMGQSAADILLDDTGGKFGPFAGQLFVGDQMNCSVMRVALEKVGGKYQGACFPFLEGLDSGTNRVAFAPDGSMLVGQTDRGWGSLGRKSYGLQRVVYTGVEPFEILAMRALADGFELEFTRDVDPSSAEDPGSYRLESYTYEYHADYGAPEADARALTIASARVSGPRTVRLRVEGLRTPYVHELTASGVRSAAASAKIAISGSAKPGGANTGGAGSGAGTNGHGRPGEPLLHEKAYYTLVRIPGQEHAAAAPTKEALPKVLFLTHSAGFVHDVVKRPDASTLSIAEQALIDAAKGQYEVHATQDCSEINAASLAQYGAVIFYTTGELPIDDAGKAALIERVKRGAGFVGIHCAADTFYQYPPYQEMLGGVFDGHPWHQEVRVDIESGGHPATMPLERGFLITDEIYQFRDFRRHPLNVLLTLEPSSVDLSKGKRQDRDYALAWCRDWGEGRVFYTALGHRPEVWKDPRFLSHLLGGIEWALRGPEYSPPAPRGSTNLACKDDLARWVHRNGEDARWLPIEDGMQVEPGTGDLMSRAEFGDALMHVEFLVPESGPEAHGEERGNSGVYVQGRYEIQVLDSYGVQQPGKGDCGAVYGKRAPIENACRRTEVWQAFDMRFHAPVLDAAGKKQRNARISVWLNGLLVQDEVELEGATPGGIAPDEVGRGPLLLQEHGGRVRYRNVWVVPG